MESTSFYFFVAQLCCFFIFLILPNCWGNKDSDGSFHILLGFHQVGFELVQTTEVTKTGRTCEVDLLNSVVLFLQHVSTPEIHSRKRLEFAFARRIKAKILDTDLWGYVDILYLEHMGKLGPLRTMSCSWQQACFALESASPQTYGFPHTKIMQSFHVWIHLVILGGGFKYFLFSPLFGEMIQFWLIFFKGVGSTTNQYSYVDLHFHVLEHKSIFYRVHWALLNGWIFKRIDPWWTVNYYTG